MFCDTSVLLNTSNFLKVSYKIVPKVVYELEKLKNESEGQRAYQVRRAFRAISDKQVEIYLPNEKKVQQFIKKHDLPDNNDSRIIVGSLLTTNDILYTSDKAQYEIGNIVFPNRMQYVECDSNNDTNENQYQYMGWRKLYLTEEEMSKLYSDPKINHFKLKINQYAKIYENQNLVDIIRWNGQENINLNYKNIRSHYLGDIKPLDAEQKMLFDMLQNKDIKVQMILGSFGCGKSFIALAHALDFVQRGYYDGIVFVRNNYNLKDTKDIGALPGDELDKLYPYLMPIADHVGGTMVLDDMISSAIIEPIHLGFLRGRDIQHKIILCDECENMTKQQMQLLIGRISKGSQLWLIGDRKQTDAAVFEKNSGIKAVTQSLAGDPLFGMVKLVESHRSEAAKLADKLDS